MCAFMMCMYGGRQLQEKNRLLKRINKKGAKPAHVEEKEQGFSTYFAGANEERAKRAQFTQKAVIRTPVHSLAHTYACIHDTVRVCLVVPCFDCFMLVCVCVCGQPNGLQALAKHGHLGPVVFLSMHHLRPVAVQPPYRLHLPPTRQCPPRTLNDDTADFLLCCAVLWR
jgi:hypothetical protein